MSGEKVGKTGNKAIDETGCAPPGDVIDTLCAAAGVVASGHQVDLLLRYLQLLQRWNATYNLTSVRRPADMVVQHIGDCLAVIAPLTRHARSGRLLDVGSGGGLPGVVIAALLPEWSVTSVDAVGKKAAFVRQVASALPLANLRAQHARVEHLQDAPFDVVASRAFASLGDFALLSARLLTPTGVWMAMKGKVPEEEIAALPAGVDAFHVEHLVVPGLNAARCLVWMRITSKLKVAGLGVDTSVPLSGSNHQNEI